MPNTDEAAPEGRKLSKKTIFFYGLTDMPVMMALIPLAVFLPNYYTSDLKLDLVMVANVLLMLLYYDGYVKTGSGLGYALGRQKVFPRLAVQMVQVGEESGELDTMLLKVADTFDQETANALDRLMAALVPALTILMTVVVAVIILSVLLPIYDLTNAIG